ncbi:MULTISPECIES: outer membrane protein assembly factor BamB [Comamonas]|jgi:outer membrane assembly lipoprotein YfgL|uniref:Outer membrane protein assembly factor BamB n=1 Tax=Comamonas terrigena TaxID=32013 RepID=A0A2A7UYH6_COMTR|nr:MULTISPECIES: outer membrane protein assembly factor BamB [Comamonas]MBD9534031.1 outer membrane protein assembly factor BamB [Comamonas sp. CMM01]MBV7416865.1 outer membrane protein assembly factor BamB [Comamonas sp. CMM03]MDH1292019.1 outer membrane protein assembly factor BamB [Comamonas terrigena]MDI9855396.1 outer membrane protein assembly factor BamB [Comamonas sp. 17RB]PEH90246.1 outer membrane protein assembly factor BamB [Comamonas terrigena]
MTVGRWAASAALVTALGGCAWFGTSKPKPQDLGPNVVKLDIRQAWTARVGAIKDVSLSTHVLGDAVYVSAADGTVVALNARNGQDLWRTTVGKPLSSGVGSDGVTTAVVTKSNELIGIIDGKQAWSKRLEAGAYTAPLVAGARVFLVTADRTIAAYDARTGQALWSQPRTGEPLVLRQPGVLQAVGNTLVTGMAGRLVALQPDNGAVLWEAPLASPRGTNDVERLVDLVGPTFTQGNVVCARAFQASVGCVDAARGQVLWTQTARGSVGVGGDAELLAGTESNGVVQAWDRADGKKLWSVERFQHRRLTAPLLLGRSVIMGDDAGLVHVLSKQDGSHLNRLQTDGSGMAAAPVVAADTLVVVTRNGGVYGFRPE